MNIDYKDFGKRVATRRKVLKLTQDNVAEKTGLSNNHISNIENNHSIPSLECLMKICDALETTPDYLLLGTVKHLKDGMLNQTKEKLDIYNKK